MFVRSSVSSLSDFALMSPARSRTSGLSALPRYSARYFAAALASEKDDQKPGSASDV
jgi:hypothetical protein